MKRDLSWRSDPPRINNNNSSKRSHRMVDRWYQQPKMAFLQCYHNVVTICCCCCCCCCRRRPFEPLNNTVNNLSSSSSSSLGEDAGVVMVGTIRPNLLSELWTSTDMLFQSRLMWLLALGLLALVGDATGLLGEAACFCLSGMALIPCAERLSYVTEQVASRTNGTMGALLNATFGNAPELLISTAALRAGFYRVVQLAMLGSMLTNLLFVFGLSCLVGGIRWQVQTLRIPSGGVSVSMLLLATAGSLLPAALEMSGQFTKQQSQQSQQQSILVSSSSSSSSSSQTQHAIDEEDIPTREELQFCRVNAAVMIIMYACYLLFQLGTHKEEFDDDHDDEKEELIRRPQHDNEQHEDDDDVDALEQRQVMVSKTTKARRHVIATAPATARPNAFCLHYFTCCANTTARSLQSSSSSSSTTATTRTTTSAILRSGALLSRDGDDDDDDIEAATLDLKPRADVVDGRRRRRRYSDNVVPQDNDDNGDDHDNGDDGVKAMYNSTGYYPDSMSPKLRDASSGGGGGGDDMLLTNINEMSPKSAKTPTGAKGVSPHLRRKKSSFDEMTTTTTTTPDDHDVAFPLSKQNKMNRSDRNLRSPPPSDPNGMTTNDQRTEKVYLVNAEPEVTMSLRAGIVWLFALTICISALSDILVDTIDGFAQRMHMSEVFTSMVILPFFSNVAEQVSAVLFAYRNEMDLCVGVTVGSAVQIATFVLPGCVLIGAAIDRSMTLFFHGYETVCLLLGVICVSAVLQGGTTNWLVGVFLISIYIMIATGIWFHEAENLSTDAEIAIHNSTMYAT